MPRCADVPERSLRLPSLLLAALTALTFLPVCTMDFVAWDDTHNLVANPHMNPPSLGGVGFYWANAYKDLYIPLTYTVWSALAAVARTADGGVLNSYVFHTFNLLLHIGGALLVLAILNRLGLPRGAAFLGAAVFAVHPVQVEPVAWVSGLKDVLAGTLALAALLGYIEYLSDDTGYASRPPAPIKNQKSKIKNPLLLATAAFVLAMLAKPSAVVVPLMAAVLGVMWLRRSWRQALAPAGLWLLLAVPVMFIARLAQPAAQSLAFVPPLWARPLVAADALAFYAMQLVFPAWLAIDYGRNPQWLLESWQRYVTWLVPVAMAVACVAMRRSLPALAAGCALFVAALLPVLGLVPFDFQAYSTVADHYLYLAMLGPALLVAAVAQRWGAGARVVLSIIVVILAIRSHVQTLSWRDSRTLFEHTVYVNPASVAGNVNLAREYAREAELLLAAGQIPQAGAAAQRAIDLYSAALASSPGDAQAHAGMGGMMRILGRWDRAEEHYRRAIKHGGGSTDVLTALGAALANQGRIEEAIDWFEAALRQDPPPDIARIAEKNLEQARRILSTRPAQSP
jgi:tetratricopeptide (TPR) repeat protein